MDSQLTVALILVLCIMLVVVAYFIGVEVGKKTKHCSASKTAHSVRGP